ncbi:unnamed protein product [Penicillium roqueforti FM164]|uniref:Genomic scaffold, ProqFM164S02 n=1 Tax=Penicillium roqueforti (strain FM164) TaxID=1365484 RepID=W6QD93_PENRF|nr:unnamed protein product [Penicillium roqueforti FM164]
MQGNNSPNLASKHTAPSSRTSRTDIITPTVTLRRKKKVEDRRITLWQGRANPTGGLNPRPPPTPGVVKSADSLNPPATLDQH